MGAVKPTDTVAWPQGLQLANWPATPANRTAPQFRPRPAIGLVPPAGRVSRAGPAGANDDAADTASANFRDADLRWLGSLICMVTALLSASSFAWMLL